MKKTFTLSIGGSVFHVEEDAYEKLEKYISSIRAHFENNPDKEEILRDIESRIAEKFEEKKHAAVSLLEVEEVIASMGTVDQFEDDEEGESKAEEKVSRKLYRDTDTGMIAGVSSGLGHFFGVDPIIFRILFVLSILAGGTGIILYVVLWLLVPEAKTPSQKLAMKGSAATISAMADMVKEKIAEVNTVEHRSALAKLVQAPFDFIRAVMRAISSTIFPFLRVSIGLFLLVGSFMFAFGATIAASFALFALSPTFIEGPLLQLFQSDIAQIAKISTYLVVLIPLIFIGTLGVNLISKRAAISKLGGLSLLAVWFISIAVSGATGTKLVMTSIETFNNDPYYKRDTQTVELPSFTSLVIEDNQSVRVVEGDTYKLEIKARAQDLNKLSRVVENNTLTLTEIDEEKSTSCLLCGGEYVDVVLTVPTLSSVTLKNGAHLNGDLKASSLSINLDDSSSLSLDTVADTVTGDVLDYSRAYLRGTINTLTLNIKDSSRLDANQAEIKNAVIKVANRSNVEIYATAKLDVNAMNNSYIRYMGTPEIKKQIDVSSHFEGERIEQIQ